jgi:hypothetical protein
MNEEKMKQEFESLVPWYVNGTLEPKQREWVEQYVRDHPEAASELRWHESLQNKIRENSPAVPPDIGWDKFQRRIREEGRSVSPRREERTGGVGPGFFQIVGAWVRRPSMAYIASALVVVQAGVIGSLMLQHGKKEQEFSEVRSVRGVEAARGPVLQVRFKPETPERDIRLLLAGVNGDLVGGPGQLGDYIVSVPADQIATAAKILGGSASIEMVNVLPTMPSKE